MTKQNKRNKQKSKRAKKATPFADAGAITGQRLGSMFNMPYLKGIGKWLGSGIGHIMGSGDYTLMGALPSYNVLCNGNQIPQFNSNKQTNIICHREYIGDIDGLPQFLNRPYPLNPGMEKTFPWLSSIARNYQEYKFHGLIFEFRPLITDFVTSGAPGVVIMATNYNADAPYYTTKQAMENSEYAVSVKPTENLMHGIECAVTQTVLPQLYVRSGIPPSGQDLRLYDQGSFQFASQGNPSQLLGELWVSYCVEFFKPIIAGELGGETRGAYINRTSVSAANPLGLIGVVNRGDLTVAVQNNQFSFTGNPDQLYLVTYNWTGTGAVIAFPTFTYSNCETISIYRDGAAAFGYGPQATVTTNGYMYQVLIRCNTTGQSTVSVVLGNAGSFPTGTTSVDLFITEASKQIVG